MVSSSLSEQPTEVSLCHLTSNPVTTESLGTLPVIMMAVDEGDVVPESSAADGTEREKLGVYNSFIDLLRATVPASTGALGRTDEIDAVPITDMVYVSPLVRPIRV